jgi:hypothetical protein
MNKYVGIWTVGLAAMVAGAAHAALVIDVGRHPIRPAPGQVILLSVTGADLVDSVDLYVQLGDGGWENGGFDTVPVIESLTLLAPGTIFHANNREGEYSALLPLIGYAGTEIDEALGQVVASGWLAVLTIDASGTCAGEAFPLLLGGVGTGIFGPDGIDTAFASVTGPIALEIINGWILVGPQPDALVWDGSTELDGFEWGSPHWEDGAGLVAPLGGETFLVDAGWVGVTADHTQTPVERLIIDGATVAVAESGALAVEADVVVRDGGSLVVDGTLAAGQVISHGLLAVDGTLTSTLVVSNGTLSGSGTIDAPRVTIGGTLSPGGPSASPLGVQGLPDPDGSAGVWSTAAASGGAASVPEPAALLLLAAAAVLLPVRRAARRPS